MPNKSDARKEQFFCRCNPVLVPAIDFFLIILGALLFYNSECVATAGLRLGASTLLFNSLE